jgi:hypothetical protein
MLFGKPVFGLVYDDIEGLTSSGEHENVWLDYKKSISGSERDKAELAKDISALANSQGGYLIIGVEERNGRPVHPPCGTEPMLGRQKVEDWIAQTANANIAQRVQMDVRTIPLPDSSNCIVVIHVPISIRMPHMVTYRQDNRYYRRIFNRHQFESLPAEEYEVREMFEKGSQMVNRVFAFLSSQGYTDISGTAFAQNAYTKQLGMIVRGGNADGEVVQAYHYVTFVAFPNIVEEDLINTSKDEFWHWLDPDGRRYQPAPRIIFLPLNKRATLEGVVLMDRRLISKEKQTNFVPRFLRINRNSYIEMGLSLAISYESNIAFAFATMIGFFWQFMNFVRDVYSREGILMPCRVMLNMKGTENSLLYDLGHGWLDPFDAMSRHRPQCLEPNVQIVKELRSVSMDDDEIATIVREFATRVDNAWGERIPRCYNHSTRDPEEKLRIDNMPYFVS